jgi:NADPH2:quinone reductase
MKSIRVHQFGAPDVLKLEELPDPQPAIDQLVVKLDSIGVNPVETYFRSGKYGPKAFPYTPGTDAAGVVEATGSNVKSVTVGQRVYVISSITGTYAEKALCTPDQVYPLPERLSFDQGAGIGVPFGTAYRALFIRGMARPNEIVLIHGASGGVGTACVQLASNHGCVVFGTAGTAEGLDLVKKLGGSESFNHHSNNYAQQILDRTGGGGVDLIIEFLADKNLDKDLGMLARRGRVVVVGNRGRADIDARRRCGIGTHPRRTGSRLQKCNAYTCGRATFSAVRRSQSARGDHRGRHVGKDCFTSLEIETQSPGCTSGAFFATSRTPRCALRG